MLTLVFGASTPAISTVLAAFMGGLALGSFLRPLRRPAEVPAAHLRGHRGGRRRLRAGHPPGHPRLPPRVHGDHPTTAATASTSSPSCASSSWPLVLLPPTTLMGATLPLLARHFVQRRAAPRPARRRPLRRQHLRRRRGHLPRGLLPPARRGPRGHQRHRRLHQPRARRAHPALPQAAPRRRVARLLARAPPARREAADPPPSPRSLRPRRRHPRRRRGRRGGCHRRGQLPRRAHDPRGPHRRAPRRRRLGLRRARVRGDPHPRPRHGDRVVGLLVHHHPHGLPHRHRRRQRHGLVDPPRAPRAHRHRRRGGHPRGPRALQYVVYQNNVSRLVWVIVTLVVLLGTAIAASRRKPMLALGVTQLLIGAGAIATYFFQDRIPQDVRLPGAVHHDQLRPATPVRFSQHVGTIQWLSFVIALLCALPAAVGMGAAFPLGVRAYTRGRERVGADTSRSTRSTPWAPSWARSSRASHHARRGHGDRDVHRGGDQPRLRPPAPPHRARRGARAVPPRARLAPCSSPSRA
jgi:hypothetical protein